MGHGGRPWCKDLIDVDIDTVYFTWTVHFTMVSVCVYDVFNSCITEGGGI